MLADDAQLRMFALNIYFLIGALLVLGLLGAMLFAAVVAIRSGLWQLRRKQAEQAEHRRKVQPNGQPYPPAAQGLCDRCGGSFLKVYHLPAGRRFCPECYDIFLKETP